MCKIVGRWKVKTYQSTWKFAISSTFAVFIGLFIVSMLRLIWLVFPFSDSGPRKPFIILRQGNIYPSAKQRKTAFRAGEESPRERDRDCWCIFHQCPFSNRIRVSRSCFVHALVPVLVRSLCIVDPERWYPFHRQVCCIHFQRSNHYHHVTLQIVPP